MDLDTSQELIQDFDNEPNDAEEEFATPSEVLSKLEEAWQNEKFAPELLPYEGEIVSCMLDQISHMEENLHLVSAGDFRIPIHKLELERTRYILHSYLRTRLEKVEKHGAFLVEQEELGKLPSNILSADEKKFAKLYAASIEEHFQKTVLDYMPSNMQNFKLSSVGNSGDLSSYVFIKSKKAVNGVMLSEDPSNTQGDDIVDLDADSQHILPYQPIAHLVKNGDVILI